MFVSHEGIVIVLSVKSKNFFLEEVYVIEYRNSLEMLHYSAKSGYFEFLQWISLDGSFGKRAA